MNTTIALTKLYTVAAKAGEGGTAITGDGDKLGTLLNNVYATIVYYAGFAGVIALAICGLVYLISSDQQTAAQAKKWALRIFIGLAIIMLASVIVNAFTGVLAK